MAYEPHKWAFGLIPAGLLWIVGTASVVGPIESDISTHGAASLPADLLEKPALAVAGRDVSIAGAVFAAGGQQTVVEAILATRGVRLVDAGALTLIPEAKPYVWSATREGDKIALVGSIPDPAARADLLDAAKAIAGADVADSTAYQRGDMGGLTVAGAFALSVLGKLSSGVATFSDGTLTIAGKADDSDAFVQAMAALAKLPAGVKLANADIAAPPVAPFVFSAASADGALKLTGAAPSIAARDALTATAKSLFPNAKIDNALTIASGLPPGVDFAAGAGFALAQLKGLDSGEAHFSDADFSIKGHAADAATAEAVETDVASPPAGLKLASVAIEHPQPPPAPLAQPSADQAAASPAPSAADQPAASAASAEQTADVQPAASPLASGPPLDVNACQEGFKQRLIGTRIEFETGKADISHASDALLNDLAAIALRCATGQIEISGHTDNTGQDAQNVALSKARAEAIVSFLIRAGIAANRLSATGYGSSQPIASNDTEEGRAQNRRIEFSVKE
jgi:OmpA-OmpF porin, OOP family